ncbi:RcnB family protein [Sphingomonas bacterium]|uniref:RcnB family protein n=1 Tax=Sphingomonas bacterium TaxID=1895847 RepID=UPI0015752EEE|nr:RcnB family protein [Sphingomonas bacterium]
MKTFRTALLAAAFTAAIPALASALPDDQDAARGDLRHRDNGGERGDRGGGRPDRAQAAPQQAVPQQQAEPARQAQVRAQEVQQQAVPDRRNFEGRGGRDQRNLGTNDTFRTQQARGVDNRGFANRGFDNRGRDDRRGPDGNNGFRAEQARGYAGNGNRGGDWRRDQRYDWRGYRNQNREIFRASRYIAPRNWGYGYRRFDIGFRLPPFLFAQNYWITDPWAYRLPPADGPYRWVRYYDDVLLIDLRSGQIVDEIPGFFW